MLAGGLQAGNRAFGGAHAGGDGLLSKAGAGTRCEHFVGEGVFELQRFVGFVETASRGCLLKERLVVVAHGLEFEISHFVGFGTLPFIRYASQGWLSGLFKSLLPCGTVSTKAWSEAIW